ncbi:MAG: AzlC family ABC transporter permease [Devosia sp.]
MDQLTSNDHANSVRHAIWAGAHATRSMSVGAVIFGVLFGAISAEAGLSAVEAVTMSALVFAGSAQFTALELWTEPVPIAAICITGALVCSRHIFMGLTMPAMIGRPANRPPLVSLFLLTDVTWILTQTSTHRHRLAFFVASGLAMYPLWVIGTAAGHLGAHLFDPVTLAALGAAGPLFVVIFLSMQAKQLGRRSYLPYLASGLAAAGSSLVLDPSVAVLVGVGTAAVVTIAAEVFRANPQ